jgi:hypothetical protein
MAAVGRYAYAAEHFAATTVARFVALNRLKRKPLHRIETTVRRTEYHRAVRHGAKTAPNTASILKNPFHNRTGRFVAAAPYHRPVRIFDFAPAAGYLRHNRVERLKDLVRLETGDHTGDPVTTGYIFIRRRTDYHAYVAGTEKTVDANRAVAAEPVQHRRDTPERA